MSDKKDLPRVIMHQVDEVPVELQKVANLALTMLGLEVLSPLEGANHMMALARKTLEALHAEDPELVEGCVPPPSRWSVILLQGEYGEPIPDGVQVAMRASLAKIGVKLLSPQEGQAIVRAVFEDAMRTCSQSNAGAGRN